MGLVSFLPVFFSFLSFPLAPPFLPLLFLHSSPLLATKSPALTSSLTPLRSHHLRPLLQARSQRFLSNQGFLLPLLPCLSSSRRSFLLEPYCSCASKPFFLTQLSFLSTNSMRGKTLKPGLCEERLLTPCSILAAASYETIAPSPPSA